VAIIPPLIMFILLLKDTNISEKFLFLGYVWDLFDWVVLICLSLKEGRGGAF